MVRQENFYFLNLFLEFYHPTLAPEDAFRILLRRESGMVLRGERDDRLPKKNRSFFGRNCPSFPVICPTNWISSNFMQSVLSPFRISMSWMQNICSSENGFYLTKSYREKTATIQNYVLCVLK